MAKKQSGLGKGLDSLFADAHISPVSADPTVPSTASPLTVRLSDIEPDKNQPRKHFDAEAIKALADSIAVHGVLQPLVVRSAARPDDDAATKKRLKGKYRIISGERRWRAAKEAGLTEVPVVVKELSDTEASAVMLVENLQREDLNPVETARGLKRLIEEFGLTQEETARIVGISRPNLTNSLRLLALPENVLDFLASGDITAGHARALLPLGKEDLICEALDVILAKGYSVRATEAYVAALLKESSRRKSETSAQTLTEKVYMQKLAERVSADLGRKATFSLNAKKKGAGKLVIDYYSNDDLENLLKTICASNVFEE